MTLPRYRFSYFRNMLLTVLLLLLPMVAACQAADLHPERIKLPPGFAIELFARVPGARSMTLGTKGTLFVGSREEGKVYAVRYGGGHKAEVITLAKGL